MSAMLRVIGGRGPDLSNATTTDTRSVRHRTCSEQRRGSTDIEKLRCLSLLLTVFNLCWAHSRQAGPPIRPAVPYEEEHFMRRRILLPTLTVAAVVTSLFVAVAPASAHGYISSPPSRQANCAGGAVANCGDIIYEPQSVEAPKGSMQCNGGGGRFAVLNDNSRNWPAANVGTTVTFNWVITARHAT